MVEVEHSLLMLQTPSPQRVRYLTDHADADVHTATLLRPRFSSQKSLTEEFEDVPDNLKDTSKVADLLYEVPVHHMYTQRGVDALQCPAPNPVRQPNTARI